MEENEIKKEPLFRMTPSFVSHLSLFCRLKIMQTLIFYDKDIISQVFNFVKQFLKKTFWIEIFRFLQEKLFGIKFLIFSGKNFFKNFL